MPKIFTDQEYYRVLTYRNDFHITATQIAEELGMRRQTVAAIVKRAQETDKPMPQIKGNKRKTKSAVTLRTKEEQERLRDESNEFPFKTPKVLKEDLGLECSVATIKRRLRDQWGLDGRRAACKQLATEGCKERRLGFAHKYKLKFKNKDDPFKWDRVMFSDEVKIETSKHGLTWVRRPKGTRHDEKYVAEVNRQGRCKVMVWGAITRNKMLDLVIIEGTLNRWKYRDQILTPVVLPWKDTHPEMIFMQDNAPVHTAYVCRDWFRNNQVDKLDWPPNSPDLNPIENLWQQLKEEVGSMNQFGKNDTHRVIAHIRAAWDRMRRPQCMRRTLNGLYGSMDTRMDAVIEATGSYTKY